MRADALFEECLDDFYAGFGKGGGYYRRLDRQIRKLTAMPAVRRGSKPKILVTGEYFLRTQAEMNGQLYKKIEALGGEVLRTVLFADYAEMIPYNRPRVLWQLGRRAAAAREFFLGRFLIGDIEKIKAAFRPHIPAEIDPDPTATLPRFHHTFHNKLDASMLCEFYQTWWRMDRGGVDGIVIVHPFGCCKSAPVEPLIHKLYGDRVPVLTLSFDGQANVHGDNRLAAFMENIHARRRLPPTPRTDAERRLAAPPAAPSGIREYTHPAPQPALDRRA
jgi:predicted nucleotide-binding protein (sugar kinase/HSP70/actin superfamily)